MEGRRFDDGGNRIGPEGMGVGKRIAVGLIAAGLAALLTVGCGESDSSRDSTAGSGSNSNVSESGGSDASRPEGSSPEPSEEFLGSGPNGRLAKIGKESSVAEREAASRVLESYFGAREEGDWAGQCALLAASIKEQVENAVSLSGGVACAKALGAQAKGLPASVRANTMIGPIDALRINQGINGFAFWHGTEGNDYVIPLIKQNGWKVVALTTEEVPP